MAKVARRRARHTASPRSSPRSQTLSTLTNGWLLLGLLGFVALVAYWRRDYLADELLPSLLRQVLRLGGYGIVPAALWTLAALATLRWRREWLQRGWRWWLASGVLVTAFWTALGGVHGPSGVPAEHTLGGLAGQSLWGGTPLLGIPIAAGLTVVALTLLWPGRAYQIARAVLQAMNDVLRALLNQLGRGTWWSLKAVGRGMRRGVGILVARIRRRGQAIPEPWPAPATPGLHGPLPHQPLSSKTDATPSKPPTEGLWQTAVSTPAQAKSNGKAGIDGATLPRPAKGSSSGLAWKLPPMSLLEKGQKTTVSEEETKQVAKNIEETLSNHNIEVTVDQIKPGPTVTLYGLTPGWVRKVRDVKERDKAGNILRNGQGRPVITRKEEQLRVKVDTIVAREKDLALALAAPSLRIQAPVPGESVVGIEVPNRAPVLVTVRSVMETPTFKEIVGKGGLPLALGQGSGGGPVATDLRHLPHLLIAGATGSGKSVCINSLIISLTSHVAPQKMRLLLIDPKRVELTPFNGLPHLAVPVVVDSDAAVRALKGVLREMLRRYRRLEELGVRNIEGYQRHAEALEPMPYLVIAIDELADLMMAAPYDIEQTLCRLAQLGRATGIHLIVATQRPSVDVVTGLIKANFPSRISFAVVSQVDSRTILDAGGADRLLGKGDMLFLSHETPKPQRVQGAFLSDNEISRLMEFWRSQAAPPLPQIDLEPAIEAGLEDSEDTLEKESPRRQDDLMDKAIELATRYSTLSTSLLQRRLRIGYPRAARLMDQLEEAGVIGPGEPGKTREVLRRSTPPPA